MHPYGFLINTKSTAKSGAKKIKYKHLVQLAATLQAL
jgi:hypothetical protein